jgi:hypothetical protein
MISEKWKTPIRAQQIALERTNVCIIRPRYRLEELMGLEVNAPDDRPSIMRWITICCIVLIAALWTVGVVASEIVRHLVQTAPIWIAVVLGLRRSELTKWAALAFFIFWLFLMGLIWLYLPGWARVVSGTFSRTEITLTLIIGAVSICGIANCLRLKQLVGAISASATFLASLLLQAAAIALSITPAIEHR